MSVPDHALGRRVQCPKCEHTFRYTGQKEFTLGRIRSRAASIPAAARTMPIAPPSALTRFEGSDLDTVPLDDVEVVVEEMQTMPSIEIPDMRHALKDQFQPTLPEDPEPLVDVEESLDLEMFHSTPVETVLPEISDAEIEALFLEGEPGAGAQPGPSVRSLESTLPTSAMQQAALPVEAFADDDVVDAELFQSDTIESVPDDYDIVDAVAVNPAIADTLMAEDVVEEIVEEIEEIAEADDVDVLEAEEALVEVARIDPAETLPWQGGSPADVPLHDNRQMAAAPNFDLGAKTTDIVSDDVEEIVEEIVDDLDTIPPVSANPPPAPLAAPVAAPLGEAPVRQAFPAGMPIAATLPLGSVPTAGVLRAHIVPGKDSSGPAAPVVVPLADTLPYEPVPTSDAPIPPPTPPVKAPLADDDLDAIFREVLGDADIATAESDEKMDSIEAFAAEPTAPAEAVGDVVEEIPELEPEVGFAEPVEGIHEVEPVVEDIPEAVAEEDLDLMALFADDPSSAGEPGDEVVEEIEEVGFAFEDDPPAKK